MARSRRAGKRLRWLCPADRERVVERLRAGDRVLDVAAAFDVSGRTVERVRERAALVGRRALDSGFRLSYAERVQIEVRLGLGQSVRVVARAIGRAPST